MEIQRTSEGFDAVVDGKRAGHIAVEISDDGVAILPSTVTIPEFGGQGVGSALVKAAIELAESEGLAVHPVCPFVASWLDKHPEAAAKISIV